MYNRKQEITYLKDAKNLQELKLLYNKMVLKYHPDRNKDIDTMEIMRQINLEYEYLGSTLKNADNTKKSECETSTSMDYFKTVLDNLMKYKNITIEIIGSWVWVSGKGTFAIKDEILYNTLHFDYSRSNKKFYWYEGIENKQGKYKGGFLKQAINKYGIEEIKTDTNNFCLC